ncbi:phosphoacetylglucosamine mutase [Malassezia cuniculi]|uniref:Phosphoacetylglucosamine mutase n=1 Tax=Malassezia cuniculi TaxID=948313 RepID=A0AAF0J5W0_9BASI|nr:phosphoacetylglucosamine mutase [Malassezia cuniculi]
MSIAGTLAQTIEQRSAAHPKPDARLTYGTAGFRTKASLLESTCFRIGLIGALRSKSLGGKTVGLMVTASHNPEEDNGVKMVDARGEMLEASWEPICTAIANAATGEELVAELNKVVEQKSIDLSVPASVVYAYDTRPSSKPLAEAMVDGLGAFDTNVTDGGLLTTPQLHYLVLALNTQHEAQPYGSPTTEGYYAKLAGAYMSLMKGRPAPPPLIVDCANGVGTVSLKGLLAHLRDALVLYPVRTAVGQTGALNNGCGADFVKSKQRLPEGFEHEPNVHPGELLCSFDGDADRIMFYYLVGPATDPANFRMLDGDKIASLAADHLGELVHAANLDVNIGCVQTAYANGASTTYLEQRVPITCTPTGVKHLHHAAEKYDIGVYFEANGHGTVLFSEKAQRAISEADTSKMSPESAAAIAQLAAFAELINQTVGDAVSDMLMVLVILAMRGWGPREWDATYTDLPNKLVKVAVADRTQFRTTDAERRVTHPEGLQERIDALVAKYPSGRAFVRPSGTEDCVRVYAEAEKPEDVAELASATEALVKEFGA